MIVSMHQPHYFPWTGYLNKIARSDSFILENELQLTDRSFMYRHHLLMMNGNKEYITIPYVKQDCLSIPYRDILINSSIDWQKKHINFIKGNYSKSQYYNEVMDVVMPIFLKRYSYLCDVTMDSIYLLLDVFKIKTKIIIQSDLDYRRGLRKTDLLVNMCQTVGASMYLSGNGAKKYMDDSIFAEQNIKVIYQNYIQPKYAQLFAKDFIPGLSSLDLLFSIGIENSRELFNQSL